MRDLEPQLVFLELGPLDRLVAASLLAVSLGASLFGGLAGLAMLLAGLGLYGVIAFGVAQAHAGDWYSHGARLHAQPGHSPGAARSARPRV